MESNVLSEWSNQKRLQTFFCSPLPTSQFSISNSPLKLAEAGFILSRADGAALDEVECLFCGVRYHDWSGESPMAVHRTLNPKCIFLNTPPTCSSSYGSSNNFVTSSKISHRQDDIKTRYFPQLSHSPTSIFSVLDVEHPFLPKQGGYIMLFECHRLLTFIYKDLISSFAEVYAQSGFMYNVVSKKVFCVYCNLELEFNFVTRDDLENIHYEKSPLCPFVNMFDVGNISIEEEKRIRDKAALQLQQKSQSNCSSKYAIIFPQYEEVSVRYGTFATWPKWLAKVVPVSELSDCGFYYTGFSDKVTCFACGVGLSDWSPDVIPAQQHAKASPLCVFLLQTRGQQFIDSAQSVQLLVEKHQDTPLLTAPECSMPLLPEQPGCSSASPPLGPATRSSPTSSFSSAVVPGSPTLDLEAIRAALACQYSIEQITRAIQSFFDMSFRYPNETLLLGTLKAADEHYQHLCEKSQQMLVKEALYKEKEAEFQAKEAQLRAEKAAYQQQITARERELQRTTFELELRDLVRVELEQRFVEQLQQQKELLLQQKEEIDQRDQVIEYKEVQIQDQDKHIQSLMAELSSRLESSLSADEEAPPSESQVGCNSDEIPLANCKVCLVKPSQIMFLPCKHICCCDGCASRLQGHKCPICRQRSISYEKVYLI